MEYRTEMGRSLQSPPYSIWTPVDSSGLSQPKSHLFGLSPVESSGVQWTEWMEWTPLPKKATVEHLLRTLNMFKLY